jgi:N-acetylglucosamine-6-phosphate deacetylase
MNTLEGQVVTGAGIVAARMQFTDRIVAIEPLAHAPDQWILPGVLDWHNHGGGGGDVMDGEAGIRQLAETHARFGMTGFLATTVTAERDAIDRVLEAAARVMADRKSGEARCHGVHLEGPYLSAQKLGAQPERTRAVDAAELASWFSSGVVRVMTYAPEQDPDGLIPALAQEFNVRLQIGHSGCLYHRAESLLAAGHGITHVFNAMSGVSHREPGVALAALNHAEFSEIICDGLHVEEPAFQLARRQIAKLYGVTDATAAAGMPDGEYALGSHRVHKANGAVRLADGTLAGSASTATTTIETLRRFGLSWPEIVAMVAARPAEWLWLSDFGRLDLGCAADLVVWGDSGPESVWIDGQIV